MKLPAAATSLTSIPAEKRPLGAACERLLKNAKWI